MAKVIIGAFDRSRGGRLGLQCEVPLTVPGFPPAPPGTSAIGGLLGDCGVRVLIVRKYGAFEILRSGSSATRVNSCTPGLAKTGIVRAHCPSSNFEERKGARRVILPSKPGRLFTPATANSTDSEYPER